MRLNWKLVVSAGIFALCIAPTMVSYAGYSFRWDDSDYLWKAMAASRAFWSGHRHELGIAIRGSRSPVMTLLGLPWGSLGSWDAAGKCFVSLAAFNAVFVACCLYLLLRVGLKPLYLVIASVCVFAAIGPYPAGANAHLVATGLLADSLFAWTAFAAMLLIPYEATTLTSATKDALVRGILWALIFLVGAIIKASFFYFIAVTIPVLFVVKLRNSGLRSALLTLTPLTVFSLPVITYWLLYGKTALDNARAAAFGPTAHVFYVPLSEFVSVTIRRSPGMLLSWTFVIAAIMYLSVKRRDFTWGVNLSPLLIIAGYCAIALASSNREIRFLLAGIVAIPFLIALLTSGKTSSVPRGPATIAAALVFCFVVAVALPMLHRANRQSIAYGEAVLNQAAESNAKHIVLATNSSTLNYPLIELAMAVSPSQPPVEITNLAYRAASGSPIEDDLRDIREADLIVFQNNDAVDSPYVNPRISEYEQYARQHFGGAPINVGNGLRMYGIGPNHR